MSRLTGRDVAVLVVFAVLAVGIVVCALLDQMALALSGIGLLAGAMAILAHVQFVVRRATYDVLRRAGREANRSLSELTGLVEESRRGADPVQRELARVHGEIARAHDSVRAELLASRDDSAKVLRNTTTAADAAKGAREGGSEVLLEMAALRAELRGVRVAQQLFSRSIAQVQRQLAAVGLGSEQLTESAHRPQTLVDSSVRDELA